jgi:uncharacterized membrane protein
MPGIDYSAATTALMETGVQKYMSGGLDSQLPAGLDTKPSKMQAVQYAQTANQVAQSTLPLDSPQSKTGAAIGTAAGAIIGSIVPGLGTALGAAIGSLVGALVGWGVAELFESSVAPGIFPFCNWIYSAENGHTQNAQLAYKRKGCEIMSGQVTPELYEQMLRLIEKLHYEQGIQITNAPPRTDGHHWEALDYIAGGNCSAQGYCGQDATFQNISGRLVALPSKIQQYGGYTGQYINGEYVNVLCFENIIKDYPIAACWLAFVSNGMFDFTDAVNYAKKWDQATIITAEYVKTHVGGFSSTGGGLSTVNKSKGLSGAGKAVAGGAALLGLGSAILSMRK